jgi:hypothetical protein
MTLRQLKTEFHSFGTTTVSVDVVCITIAEIDVVIAWLEMAKEATEGWNNITTEK